MSGHYKDTGEVYLYQVPLIKGGYGTMPRFIFTYQDAPGDFAFPKIRSGWAMRRAIKEWATKAELQDYVIVRANGYWRDLHGPWVYEIWQKESSGGRP